MSSWSLEPRRQGKIRAQAWEALEIIWHCLCPQHASAHHSVPGEPSGSLLLAFRRLPPHHSYQHGRGGEHRTARDLCRNSTHRDLFTDTPGPQSKHLLLKVRGTRTEAPHLQPFNLWVLVKLVSSTVSTNFRFCQILWYKPKVSATWDAEAKRLQVQGQLWST